MASSKQQRKPKIGLIIRRVAGHSMLPVLPPGTLVIAHKYIKTLKPGQVVIARHDDKEKIKRINEIKDNQVNLVGDHQTGEKQSHSIGWISQDRILARVVWPRRLKKH